MASLDEGDTTDEIRLGRSVVGKSPASSPSIAALPAAEGLREELQLLLDKTGTVNSTGMPVNVAVDSNCPPLSKLATT